MKKKVALFLVVAAAFVGCKNLSLPKVVVTYDPKTDQIVVDTPSSATNDLQVYRATNGTVIIRKRSSAQ